MDFFIFQYAIKICLFFNSEPLSILYKLFISVLAYASKRKNGVSVGILPIKSHFKAYIKHEKSILDTAQNGIIKDQFHSNPKDNNC